MISIEDLVVSFAVCSFGVVEDLILPSLMSAHADVEASASAISPNNFDSVEGSALPKIMCANYAVEATASFAS